MSAKPLAPSGRRGFFLAIAAEVTDAVVAAARVVAREGAEAAPPPAEVSAAEPAPAPRRRNAVPTSIPDVRLDDE